MLIKNRKLKLIKNKKVHVLVVYLHLDFFTTHKCIKKIGINFKTSIYNQ